MSLSARTKLLPRDALGLGLRMVHFQDLLRHPEGLDYLEVISENVLDRQAAPRQRVGELVGRMPVVLHGVGLNLLGAEPLDESYLDQLAELCDDWDVAFVSDHLCWSASGGLHHHDLLPTPFSSALLDFAAARAAYVQRRLQRPFGLENLSSYLRFPESDMSEWEFYTRVVQDSETYFMLDINNVYVSSVNHGFDPKTYLEAIDYRRVLQVHIAGHEAQTDALIIDTHDHPVADAVWELYRYAWHLGGPFPTLLEWDAKIPPLESCLSELKKARIYQG